MITGFNTDIEHDGVIYHVQTEDKGLETPIILSLVYAGGTILASKRSPYEDLIAEGFSDEVLAERLKRQHRLICAAIHSGRIDDLKKMGGRQKDAAAVQEETIPQEGVSAPPPVEEPFEIEYWPMTQEWTPPPPAPPEETIIAEPEQQFELVDESGSSAEVSEAEEAPPQEVAAEEELPDGLVITLLDDEEFYSGQRYTLRVLVSNRLSGQEQPLPNVSVSIKILGTTFRPLIYTLKTESDGVASVSTEIPQFTSGRAAVLVRAVARDQAAELRRIIQPSQWGFGSLRVYVNGESREVQGNPSLAELIDQLDLPAARIAVELNREVVRRGEWGDRVLRDEDRIEIVHFVGGG